MTPAATDFRRTVRTQEVPIAGNANVASGGSSGQEESQHLRDLEEKLLKVL